MTKKEREILSKKISSIIKKHKDEWLDLKIEIFSYGFQSTYTSEDLFINHVDSLIEDLSKEDKDALILEWKSQTNRIQFETEKKYINQYKLFVMEELVSRAVKATSRM